MCVSFTPLIRHVIVLLIHSWGDRYLYFPGAESKTDADLTAVVTNQHKAPRVKLSFFLSVSNEVASLSRPGQHDFTVHVDVRVVSA